MEKSELVYTPTDIAGILHLSLPSVYQAISAGEIPSLRFGRKLVIPKVAFNRMLSEAGAKTNGISS